MHKRKRAVNFSISFGEDQYLRMMQAVEDQEVSMSAFFRGLFKAYEDYTKDKQNKEKEADNGD